MELPSWMGNAQSAPCHRVVPLCITPSHDTDTTEQVLFFSPPQIEADLLRVRGLEQSFHYHQHEHHERNQNWQGVRGQRVSHNPQEQV